MSFNLKKYKSAPISESGVNISSTFVVRSRCAHCAGGPKYYYHTRNPISWVSPRKSNQFNFNWIKRIIKRMSTEYYFDTPSQITSIKPFTHQVSYKGFRPKIHKNKGFDPFMDCEDYLSCGCGQTTWAFYQSSSASRPEVKNRKGRYNHKVISKKIF